MSVGDTARIAIYAAAVQIVTDTIPALQKLKEQGLIRAIGISGLPLDIFSYVLDRCSTVGSPFWGRVRRG